MSSGLVLSSYSYQKIEENPLDHDLYDVLSESDDHVSRVAKEIFGQNFGLIEEKMGSLKKRQDRIKNVFLTLFGTGALGSGIGGLIGYFYGMNVTVGVLGGLGGIATGVMTVFTSCIGVCFVANNENQMEVVKAFSVGGEAILNFCFSYESFKNEPSDLNLKDLFTKFGKVVKTMAWVNFIEEEDFRDQYGRIVDEEVKSYFGPIGKLILMHEVVKLPTSIEMKTKWDQVLTDLKNHQYLNLSKIWQEMKIRPPELKHYLDFQREYLDLDSDEILLEKIVETYSRALKHLKFF